MTIRCVALLGWAIVAVRAGNPDARWTVEQFAAAAGVPCERHDATTFDNGSPLLVHRFPHPGSPAVVLQHGLFDTSATWVLNGPSESLGFLLYSAGFDVFLANARGNSYSGPPFSWDFTWDDHARYDIPAVLALVTRVTGGRPPLGLVAHSQGGTATLAWMSQLQSGGAAVPRYLALLAPVGFLAHQQSKLMAAMAQFRVDNSLNFLSPGPFSFNSPVAKSLLTSVCGALHDLCHDIAGALFGPPIACNVSRTDVYAGHWPDVTSNRNLAQWIANARTGAFAFRDGTPVNVSLPDVDAGGPSVVEIYGGVQDLLSDPQDLQMLAGRLGYGSGRVSGNLTTQYSHMGFTWSYSLMDDVYGPMLKTLHSLRTAAGTGAAAASA